MHNISLPANIHSGYQEKGREKYASYSIVTRFKSIDLIESVLQRRI
jgi:hypothetical protein